MTCPGGMSASLSLPRRRALKPQNLNPHNFGLPQVLVIYTWVPRYSNPFPRVSSACAAVQLCIVCNIFQKPQEKANKDPKGRG